MSVSLTITQKTVFHHFSFPYPNCVTLLQILTSIVLMHALRAGGIIQFDALSRQHVKTVRTVPALPPRTRSVAARSAPAPIANFHSLAPRPGSCALGLVGQSHTRGGWSELISPYHTQSTRCTALHSALRSAATNAK